MSKNFTPGMMPFSFNSGNDEKEKEKPKKRKKVLDTMLPVKAEEKETQTENVEEIEKVEEKINEHLETVETEFKPEVTEETAEPIRIGPKLNKTSDMFQYYESLEAIYNSINTFTKDYFHSANLSKTKDNKA
ncbi:hypothetical protein ACFL1H_07195, partial [Nanoarchaeota archaeon]